MPDLTFASHGEIKPVLCPNQDACIGGDRSSEGADTCAAGSSGPLCAVCDPFYYQGQSKCIKCPDVHVGLPVSICLVVLAVLLVVTSIAALFRSELRHLQSSPADRHRGLLGEFLAWSVHRHERVRWVMQVLHSK